MPSYRILKNLEGGAEGSAAEEHVMITRSELAALRAAVARSEGETPEAEARLKEREVEHARELAERERRAADWEGAFKEALRDRELATSLAGRPLVAGAAAQLLKLWREDFDVIEQDGRHRVTCRDGRPVSQAVAEWLASPEYAHFCQPTTRGGAVVRGVNQPSAAPAAPPPKNLGEAILRRWREAAARPEASPGTIGLHRRR